MRVSRRAALGGLVALGTLATVRSTGLGSSALAQTSERFPNPLMIPPVLHGREEAGRRIFDLEAQHGTTEFFAGRKTPTIGVNGAFLGPVVRAKAGEQVRLNVRNGLDETTTLHWHGLHIPARADGGPHQTISPGVTWSPEFEIKQKAGLFWYHSHMMERTGAQVNAGLAGPIIVDDDESQALGLPAEYGIDDIPLVIQDRRFRRDGRFDYLSAMPDVMMGFKGDVILVNGTVAPHFEVKRRRTRLRILNGSNSRIYTLGLSNNQQFTQIASDGSLLERPARMRRLQLSPGERAEILVEIQPDSTVRLMSYPDRSSGGGMGMMMGMAGNDETFALLELRAGRLEGDAPPLPERLIDVPNWNPARVDRKRTFVLEMGMGMGMMGGGMGRGMMGGGMMGGPGRMGMMRGGMTINGRTMDMERIDERVRLGATEIWAIRNASPLAHPFHIHDIQFRVLDRNGRPAGAHEQGLKDTVLVDPGETVRVITQFTDYADPVRPYMYHCHILEHEDAGMMGQFVVV
ncbi:MAG: multicopper oxidase domain-containing protein [Hyphomicrobiaceae bacterium]|nr:multicopper oxidase domain-containing protein [Hyphomicrobiaceae bacterium]